MIRSVIIVSGKAIHDIIKGISGLFTICNITMDIGITAKYIMLEVRFGNFIFPHEYIAIPNGL